MHVVIIMLYSIFSCSNYPLCAQQILGQYEFQKLGKKIHAHNIINHEADVIISPANNICMIFDGASDNPLFSIDTENLKIYNSICATIVDVNNDNYIDLALMDKISGIIYIYKGNDNFSTTPISILESEANFSGSSITSGDFNGDGFGDIIICQNPSEENGTAFIYLGKADLKALSKDIVIEGLTGYFGFSCNYAGDINNDGYSDFAIGAYTAGEQGEGVVYLFYGGPQLDNQYDVTLYGSEQGSSFGYSIEALGDLNNDGFDDILIGAPTGGINKAGQAFVFMGGSPMNTEPDFILNGENTDDFFGGSLASCHRENRQGCSDFIISAYANDETGESTGKIYAFDASKLATCIQPASTWTGEAAGDCFGYGLAAGYGVGNEEIWYWIIGAPFNDEGATDAGKIYIYPSPSALASISGKVLYRETSLGVPNVHFSITGINNIATADLSGNYNIGDLYRSKAYTITPEISKDTDISFNSIRMYDAALAAQSAIGIRELSRYELMAADVNNDNRISLYDAALIAQCTMDIPNRKDSHAKEWIFDPSMKTFDPLNSIQSDQNFIGILLGDVNGDWNPGKALLKEQDFQKYENVSATLNFDNNLQLAISRIGNEDLIAAQLLIKYDTEILNLQETQLTNLTKDFQFIEKTEHGVASVGIYSAKPIKESGTLFYFNFELLDKTAATTEIEISDFYENNTLFIISTHSLDIQELITLPKTLQLFPNYPNPFNGTTTIKFGLPKSEKVTIQIFNILGKNVNTIINNKEFEAGYHKVVWNGLNEDGNSVSSGVYFCELCFQNKRKLVKMVYVR